MDELTDAEHAALVAALHTLQRDLTTQLADTTGRTGTVTLDQSAVGRVSRIDAIQQQKMAEAEMVRAEARLQAVERALVWVADDAYGWCRRCDEPIGFRRLQARPEAPFCVQCAAQMER